MARVPPVSKECAVLFADLVGSTQLYERMGDTAAFALIDRCLRTMRDSVIGSSGRVIKMTGDGLLATFRACPQPISLPPAPCTPRLRNKEYTSDWVHKELTSFTHEFIRTTIEGKMEKNQ